MAAYAASKAAINHLTQSLAVEFGPAGIRVVAIAPGTTLTENVQFPEEMVEAIRMSHALRRWTEHDELARLTVFLASDLARCITGQLILADAGAHLSRSRPSTIGRPPDGQ
jgi:NAD(P)-dependent dehydrogenase (short-subunit alcohol dehydrogenase family)